MECVADYLIHRLKTFAKEEAEYGSDAGYGELPEGLPTDMNTFLVGHGIIGDKLHEITKEINGDYRGFLKKAKESEETWGIPQSEWNKLSTNSRIDLFNPNAKRISSEIKRMFELGKFDENFQAALMALSELAIEHSTDFEPESEEEEVWKENSESLSDLADKIDGLS